MFHRLRQRSREEGGFTLIELLVVILIIGILAAIAIPSFLNQKTKANDASAKAMARSAQTAAETYANGEYKGMSVAELQAYETTLKEKNNAELVKAEPIKEGNGYIVESKDTVTGNTFTIERAANGEISRTCKTEKTGACPAGGKW